MASSPSLREYRDEMDAMIQLDGDPDRFAAPDIDSFARYLDLNEAFHSEIVTLAKSSTLRRALDRVTAVPFASPSALLYAHSKLPRAPQGFAISHEHHRAYRRGHRAKARHSRPKPWRANMPA